MELKPGSAGPVRFIRGLKKTNIFECRDHALIVEREKNIITLYATNARCSEIYCSAELGGSELLKTNKFLGVAYSEELMLLEGQTVMAVVDFAQKQMAVYPDTIQVKPRGEWSRMPWKSRFDTMFGLNKGEVGMDEEAAREFWAWFAENEARVADAYLTGGGEAREMASQLRYYLAPVFPYMKASAVEFDVTITDEWNKLYVYHYNEEKLSGDMERLKEMMPETLKDTWRYLIRA